MTTAPIHVVFVCTGNICRSPMADVMFQDTITQAGLEDAVKVSSCGTGGWHVGDGADHRAVATLAETDDEGVSYDGSRHVAQQFGPEHHHADLLVALDAGHQRALLGAGIPPERIRLLKSFDPNATDLEVADPYYGDAAGFWVTRKEIAGALPGMLAWVQDKLTERGSGQRGSGQRGSGQREPDNA